MARFITIYSVLVPIILEKLEPMTWLQMVEVAVGMQVTALESQLSYAKHG